MDTRKLGKPTDQRLAMLSNLATDILWYGHIETTFDRAKAAARIVEKVITLAVNSYEDVVTTEKTTLDNNGKEKKVVPLEKPYEGLYVANNMWREMFDFSPDAVLLVLASEYYDEADYIRDYDEFLEFVKDNK